MPASKGGSATYFGQPVNPAYCSDTMRCYFSFPIVKVLVDKDDPNAGGKVPVGGFTDQYIFRLAETYLNRAEAYWWLGKNDLATADVNTIRRRVNAPEFSSVTLEDILDERARELFLEDHRKTELTRIAFLKAEKCGILNFEGIPETVGGLNFLLLPLPLLNLQQLGGDRYDGSIHHFR